MAQIQCFALLGFCFFYNSVAFAQVPEPAFANRYGGSGSDYGYTLRSYPDGSTVFTGLFTASVALGGITYTSQGGADAFVCKTNSAGDVLWAKILTGPGEQLLSQLAIDLQGNIVVVGQFNDNNTSFAGTAILTSGDKSALVAKLDANGNVLWAKTASNDTEADYNEVSTDAAGNAYAFGQFSGSLTVGSVTLVSTGTSPDVFLAKYSPTGDVVWAKKYGNGSIDNALAIWTSSEGVCTIGGTFLGTITFGATTHTTNGLSDIFLARIDANGDPVWSRTYGGTQIDNAFAITGDALGNIFLSGCFMQTMSMGSHSLTSNGLWDVFTAKILANGDAEWAVGFGGTDNDRCNDVQQDAEGNVLMYGWYQESMMVGDSTLTSLGLYDVFLIKLQPNGSPVWAYSFGGNSFDGGAGMDLDTAGNIYLMGDFWSADFAVGNLNLSPTSGNDVFHIRLGTEPTEIEKPGAKPSPLLRRLPDTNGQIGLEARQAGHLQVFSLNGQRIFDKTMESLVPLYLPLPGSMVVYRFESEGKVEMGKWVKQL